jgi:hypothetical protein
MEAYQLDETKSLLWHASEMLVSPELNSRIEGLQRLIELRAARQYPVIAYLIATRILEPDVKLRTDVVKVIGDVLKLNFDDQPILEDIRIILINHLAQMRTRQIFALLQVADFDQSSEIGVEMLLSTCSYAGIQLVTIASNRTAPMSIRMLAVQFIERVGYLDAASDLERLASQIDARISTQDDENEEYGLLSLLQATLRKLRAL